MSTSSTNTKGGNVKLKKIVFGIVAVVAVAVSTIVGLTGCGKSGDEGKEVVKIGAILPLTGKDAESGNGTKAGLEIALREINANSEIKYAIEYYDTKSEAKNAPMGYTRLKSVDKINIFFTSTSSHSLTLKPLAIKDSSLLICNSAHIGITKDNAKMVFRSMCAATEQAECIMNYITDSLQSKKVFVYSYNDESAHDFQKALQMGLTNNLLGTCVYEEDLLALRNISTSHTYLEADCIVVIGSTPAQGLLVKLIRESGYAGSILAHGAFSVPSIVAAAGNYAQTVDFVDYNFPYNSEQHNEWDEITLKKYKTAFSGYSYMAYGVFHILNQIHESGVNATYDIGNRLSEAKTYAISGIKFTTHPDGGITAPLRMNKIQ